MNGLAAASILALLTLPACARCDEDAWPPRPDKSESPDDATGHKDPLLGTWTAIVTTRDYGQVHAQVTLTADNWLVATVQVLGVVRTDHARLISHADGVLTIAYRGHRHQLPAKLTGDHLTVTLPVIGQAAFTR